MNVDINNIIAASNDTPQSTLGQRIKELEHSIDDLAVLDTAQIIVGRLDGRSFSKFTKNMQKPFDSTFSNAMQRTTKYLMSAFSPDLAYTQSDEITLVWIPKNIPDANTMLFAGRIQKLASVLAGATSVCFFKEITVDILHNTQKYLEMFPHFDCRLFNCTEQESYEALVWRQRDCIKNSISMAARAAYPHAALHKKCGAEKINMLLAQGISWHDYDSHNKYGTFFRKRVEEVPLTPEQLTKIPEKHRPNGPVPRNIVTAYHPGPLSRSSGFLRDLL